MLEKVFEGYAAVRIVFADSRQSIVVDLWRDCQDVAPVMVRRQLWHAAVAAESVPLPDASFPLLAWCAPPRPLWSASDALRLRHLATVAKVAVFGLAMAENLQAVGAVVVVEMAKNDHYKLPSSFSLTSERKYGKSRFTLLSYGMISQ